MKTTFGPSCLLKHAVPWTFCGERRQCAATIKPALCDTCSIWRFISAALKNTEGWWNVAVVESSFWCCSCERCRAVTWSAACWRRRSREKSHRGKQAPSVWKSSCCRVLVLQHDVSQLKPPHLNTWVRRSSETQRAIWVARMDPNSLLIFIIIKGSAEANFKVGRSTRRRETDQKVVKLPLKDFQRQAQKSVWMISE